MARQDSIRLMARPDVVTEEEEEEKRTIVCQLSSHKYTLSSLLLAFSNNHTFHAD
jgi:hypothetical protein